MISNRDKKADLINMVVAAVVEQGSHSQSSESAKAYGSTADACAGECTTLVVFEPTQVDTSINSQLVERKPIRGVHRMLKRSWAKAA